ncbi:uncharacterized protein LOC132560720 [Ylistrum balloti]|uniref:uncharacterized protein LOC132560720 n=1 Tax=Ylistrum balloti TaxID=509963 RepID=UPI0029058A72|nr:uncharacterized protein LOC132560720 [Ylistrum balloti]
MDEFKNRFLSGTPPDVIAITEVLPKNRSYTLNKAELEIPNYELFPSNFPGDKKRGAIIYVSKKINAVEVQFETDFEECVWVRISLNKKDTLLFGCMYKSPSSSEHNLEALNDLLNKVGECRFTHTVITGDFNFPDIDWDDWSTGNASSARFVECIRDNYFYQVVDTETRHRHGQESSLLDLLLVNDINNIIKTEYLHPLGASDHSVIQFEFNCCLDDVTDNSARLNYYKGDYDIMGKEMNINWEEEFDGRNTLEMWDIFIDKLSILIDKHIPMSKSRNTKGTIPLSRETVKTIKRKHRLWERYMQDRTTEKHRDYCKARNKVKRLIRKERKDKERQVAESAKSNSKNFWKFVNSKRKSRSGVSELHESSQDGNS